MGEEMKNEPKYIRGFCHFGEAWWADASRSSKFTDVVMFGTYNPAGGCEAEMAVRWVELGRKNVPQLQVFDDAWAVLASMPDLIDALRDHNDQNIDPKAFCALLMGLGFKDQTPRVNPFGGMGDRPRRETMLENTLSHLVDALASDPDSNEVHTHVNNAKQLLGRR
jgi:hypothetical protein